MKRSLRIEVGWRTLLLVPLVAGGVWVLIQIWTIALVIIAAGIRMLIDELRFELAGEDPNTVAESRVSADERAFAHRTKGASAEKAAQIATEIATKELLSEEAH